MSGALTGAGNLPASPTQAQGVQGMQGIPTTPQPMQEAATPEGLRPWCVEGELAGGALPGGEIAGGGGRAVNRQRWRPLLPCVWGGAGGAEPMPLEPAAPITNASVTNAVS
jgi:hypothetical protein